MNDPRRLRHPTPAARRARREESRPFFDLNPSSSELIKWPAPIRTTLQGYFDRIIQSQLSNTNFPFRSAQVEWWSLKWKGGGKWKGRGTSGLNLARRDLIVYFVREHSDSVIQHKPGVSGSAAPGATGYTNFQGRFTASEVYTKGQQDDPVGMANLAFHELMHFASHFSDAQLHHLQTHGGHPMVLSKVPVTASMRMSQGDLSFMVQHLPRTMRRPWTGGHTAFIDPMNMHTP